tara:strand:+ start:9942 stop:10694 length:753 start_codon:yes stop_codon:yes gene_type:complete
LKAIPDQGMTSDTSYTLTPIARVRSPYRQKFAIPRQANLVREARGEVVFHKDYADSNALRGIEQFSHLWLIFVFHAVSEAGWSPTVQPPRLGGKESIGVFASRSMFRPNPLGLSVVENLGWSRKNNELILSVGGLDLLDGTPVLDIKPYVPYADSIGQAKAGFATEIPGRDYVIEFSAAAQQSLEQFRDTYPELEAFICSVLKQDPRPAWRQKAEDDKRYGMNLYEFNIKWHINQEQILVSSITNESIEA